jgi:NAD(P)-dependent dehydrogenase (short-subunit alcohol dehydrogenase family)
MPEQTMAGRVAFITGVARGQGRAHAVRLASAGCHIVGIDICEDLPGATYPMATSDDLAQTALLIEKEGVRAQLTRGDVRQHDQVKRAFDDGVEVFGRIDTVLANAGVVMTKVEETDGPADWALGIAVNLTGVWNTINVAAPHLKTVDGPKSLIVTSSTGGLMCITDEHGGADAYTAAKLGVTALIKAYAQVLGPFDVNVVAIAPTGVNTAMVNANPEIFKVIETNPHLTTAMVNAMPVPILEPGDVSELVHFLVQGPGRYISGTTVVFDAGCMARR